MSPSFRVLPLALLVASAVAVAAPVRAAEPGDSAGSASAAPPLDVKEVVLDNGLRIHVLERTSSPTFAAVYQFDVGGAHDPKGRSGIAHLLEHMMFKGTRDIGVLDPEKEKELMARLSKLWHELDAELDKADDPFRTSDPETVERLESEIERVSAEHKKLIVKNEYDELMTRAGGVSMNASTNTDATTYFIQLPANRLELWFRAESDRLINPVFREFYSERDVVREERRMRYENSPGGMMYEAQRNLVFSAHPYGTPVIGWPRDISRLKREDALDYFRTYYSPTNCTMVLAGDIKASEVERLAKKYFAGWRRQDVPRAIMTAEPEQTGERRRVIEFDAEPRLSLAWRTVPQGHPDQYALDVLGQILGGMFSSRMDRTIVQDERIATSVGSGNSSMRFAGYFTASGTVRADHTVAELEAAMVREIDGINANGVTPDELERAKIGVEVARVRGLKSNLGQAFRVANAVRVTGGVDYIRRYEDAINAVTGDDVRRVAAEYLTPQRKNVVELRKVPGAGGGGDGEGAEVAHQRGGAAGARGAAHSPGFVGAMKLVRSAEPVTLTIPEIGRDVDRVELPSGITVFIKEDHSAPSISLSLAWLGGHNTAPLDKLAIYDLSSGLLNQGGTEALDPIAYEEKVDELGMSFGYYIGSTQSGGSFWSLSRNFDESYALAMDLLMHPRLDADRLETIRGQFIERMRRRYDSPGLGARLVEGWVFDRDHPRLGFVPAKKQIEAVTPDDVREAWRRYLGRDNLYITAVGDFDRKSLLEKIESTLGKWREAESSRREFITRDPVIRPGVYVVDKDIPQPVVRLRHHIPVDRTAPMEDHAALEILNDILGGSGFRSRLMERLRSDEGLTYGIGSFLFHEGRPGEPGSVGVSYSTKRASVAHSIESVLDEFRKIVTEKVTPAEVEEQIEAWRNRFVFRYTDDFFIVSRLMYAELDDRPYDYDRKELDAVQKVGVDDVLRVAKKYLEPGNLTISVFGRLTEEDRAALAERFPLTVLAKEQVFTGGYAEQTGAPETAPEPAAEAP